jgi:uncharacterized membrane protein
LRDARTQYRGSVHAGALDYWSVRLAGVAVALLQVALINELAVGHRWLAPVLEVIIQIALSITAARSRDRARFRHLETRLVLALIAVVTVANGLALIRLIQELLAGSMRNGRSLLVDAVNVWSTNVIAFALWYWILDRGGPAMHALDRGGSPEFAFPQPITADNPGKDETLPGFIDYLFLSFTTSTAFSPTDTLPLSRRMKMLMMAQAMSSLLTIALVAARAVNILA